jgi:acyl-coenzyme A synthetase/AMP-(fatty) acid ligase/aerobic-type carbon monoxide dehydrogenase small subunit (CoxS/CutS family)
MLLTDFLRHDLAQTAIHVGCEHGVCGACTIRVDGKAVRACLMLAIQADGRRIDTAAGLAVGGELNDLQQAFRRHHALQCGYCTPGVLMSITDYLQCKPHASEEELKEVLSGHICRCTGYVGMMEAIRELVAKNAGGRSPRIRIEHPRAKAETLLQQGLWNDDTLPSMIERLAVTKQRCVALSDGNGSLSYEELWEASRKLASGLAALGIGKGDVVAVHLPNVPEFVVAHVAANLVGAIYQPIHLSYRAADLTFHLRHSEAKAIIGLSRSGSHRPAAELLALSEELPALKHIIVVDAPEPGCVAYSDVAQTPGPPPAPPLPDDPSLLLYTSGTTSNPKGVPHSYRTLLSSLATNGTEFGLSGSDTVLTLSRFSHMWGLYSLLMGLRAGATIALLPQFAPKPFAEAVERLKPTFVFGAPVHFIQTHREGHFGGHDFSSLRVIATSGSGFPPAAMKPITDALPNGEIVELWGMTEVGPGAFTRPGTAVEPSAGTVGTPVPGCRMRIVSPGGTAVRDGEEGELEVSGAGVFSGYLGEDNVSTFAADGWFRTGDLAVRNSNGTYRITGRVKEVINRGGVKFNPLDVETALLSHPRINSCAVVPVADPVYGERACCCVVANGAPAPTLDDICAHLEARQIGKFMWPERLEVMDDLPMTATGKVRKGALADRLSNRPSEGSHDV